MWHSTSSLIVGFSSYSPFIMQTWCTFFFYTHTSTELQMFYVYTLHKEIQSLHTIICCCYFVNNCIQCHKQGYENEKEDVELILPTHRESSSWHLRAVEEKGESDENPSEDNSTTSHRDSHTQQCHKETSRRPHGNIWGFHSNGSVCMCVCVSASARACVFHCWCFAESLSHPLSALASLEINVGRISAMAVEQRRKFLLKDKNLNPMP